MDADRLIRQMLGVKGGDSLPYKGWRHTSTRADLLKIYAALGYTKGAEIGVAEGQFSEQMLQAVPNLHLLSVDPWQAYARISQGLCDWRMRKAMERLGQYPGSTVLRATSLEASRTVEDGSLDYVYIDGDHQFDSIMMDLILWGPKVRKGGMISGHDYYEFYQAGVVTAVRAYVQAHNVFAWYITWDKEASWLWVKR